MLALDIIRRILIGLLQIKLVEDDESGMGGVCVPSLKT